MVIRDEGLVMGWDRCGLVIIYVSSRVLDAFERTISQYGFISYVTPKKNEE